MLHDAWVARIHLVLHSAWITRVHMLLHRIMGVIRLHGGHLYAVRIDLFSFHRIDHAVVDHLCQGNDIVRHTWNIVGPYTVMTAQVQAFIVVMAGHTGQTTFAQFRVVPQFFAHCDQLFLVGDMFFPDLLICCCGWVARVACVLFHRARVAGITRIATARLCVADPYGYDQKKG